MIEPEMPSSGLVASVAPGSVGARAGLRAGDRLVAVSGHAVEDVIDVQFYAAEEEVELEWLRAGVHMRARGARVSGQALGLEFEHPTFDVDIRRCNNLCPFCFVLQTGPGMRRTLYIKDDDYRYSFLFGHYVTLTNLSRRDWERIAEQHLSPLYVSVHATQPEVRQACLANPAAGEILAQLGDLAAHGIVMHTQIVLTPGLNDGERLVRSLGDLSELFPSVRSCTVVPVGLTRHHLHGLRPCTAEESRVIVGTVEEMQSLFLRRLGSRFAFLTDEWYLALGRPVPQAGEYEDLDLRENGLGMARDFLTEWEVTRTEVARLGRRLEGRTATLVTAPLFAPTLRQCAGEFDSLAGTRLEVVSVPNQRLGSLVTVAGLMMGSEVTARLQGAPLGEVVVLPRLMFDHPQALSLDDVSPLQVARALDHPLHLADAMGDVLEAFTGANKLCIRPEATALPADVLRAGGWAVEKQVRG